MEETEDEENYFKLIKDKFNSKRIQDDIEKELWFALFWAYENVRAKNYGQAEILLLQELRRLKK